MATIVCHNTKEIKMIGADQYRIFDIVDGQQRLTTLIILLKAIELSLPENSDERTILSNIIVKRDGNLILLQTNNTNGINFNHFLKEGIAPKKNDILTHSDQKLADAINECKSFVNSWNENHELVTLIHLVLHRLGFVVFDLEDNQVVYTIFEVLNSRGLVVDWLDKTKSVLMGRAYELAKSPEAANDEIRILQDIWGQIYNEIANENIPGDEILRITATLFYGEGQGKPRSSENSLDLLRTAADKFDEPSRISKKILDIARKLSDLYASKHLGPVTGILHTRLLAIAIHTAQNVTESEREKLLDQWGTSYISNFWHTRQRFTHKSWRLCPSLD